MKMILHWLRRREDEHDAGHDWVHGPGDYCFDLSKVAVWAEFRAPCFGSCQDPPHEHNNMAGAQVLTALFLLLSSCFCLLSVFSIIRWCLMFLLVSFFLFFCLIKLHHSCWYSFVVAGNFPHQSHCLIRIIFLCHCCSQQRPLQSTVGHPQSLGLHTDCLFCLAPRLRSGSCFHHSHVRPGGQCKNMWWYGFLWFQNPSHWKENCNKNTIRHIRFLLWHGFIKFSSLG